MKVVIKPQRGGIGFGTKLEHFERTCKQAERNKIFNDTNRIVQIFDNDGNRVYEGSIPSDPEQRNRSYESFGKLLLKSKKELVQTIAEHIKPNDRVVDEFGDDYLIISVNMDGSNVVVHTDKGDIIWGDETPLTVV